jgi:hypothetical protein
MFAGIALSAEGEGADAHPPDFSGTGNVGWVTVDNKLIAPASGPGPVTDDPAHPHVRNDQSGQPNFRIADLSNPILKPWAAEEMRRDNEEVMGGKLAYTARSSCMPSGVPGFSLYPVEPVYFVQSAKEVLIIFSGDAQVRHVYMDVPHSPKPKPSWYGESVGHYEGDTLVVDTIGQNAKTFVDNYRTPHTEKLHVVERYHLTDGGRFLQVDISVEDPDAFTMPWSAIQRYRRVPDAMLEEICAENNSVLFDYHIPQSNRPDF